MNQININEDYRRKYGFHENVKTVFDTGRGLGREVLTKISDRKKEASW